MEAQQSCEALGMHLVTISDQPEGAFVRSELGLPPSVYVWIGLNDMSHEGRWVWVTGEPLTYIGWSEDEPNNANTGEDCASMWRSSSEWLDHPCLSGDHHVVCETEPDAVAQTCGNGRVEGGEACDDQNTSDGDTCNRACTVDCTGGRTYGTHCYLFGPGSNWLAGQEYCRSINMDYTSVSSAEEMSFIVGYRDEVRNNRYIWLGFNDIEAEGVWEWSNKETVVYTNWRGIEPNNDGNEDCLGIFRLSDTWYDLPCGNSNVPVCEN